MAQILVLSREPGQANVRTDPEAFGIFLTQVEGPAILLYGESKYATIRADSLVNSSFSEYIFYDILPIGY